MKRGYKMENFEFKMGNVTLHFPLKPEYQETVGDYLAHADEVPVDIDINGKTYILFNEEDFLELCMTEDVVTEMDEYAEELDEDVEEEMDFYVDLSDGSPCIRIILGLLDYLTTEQLHHVSEVATAHSVIKTAEFLYKKEVEDE